MTDVLRHKTSVGLGARHPRFPSSKFSPPKAISHLVHRRRLLERLDQGEQRRLTLVVGSAGAGKTTLLLDWFSRRPAGTTAWVNCDDADADPVRFFAAIIESLRRGRGLAHLGEDALQLLSVDGVVSADVVAALAGDLEEADGPGSLVVDDFHLTGGESDRALSLLLEYRPAYLQLVLATRTDPSLRLARMRANEELAELRDRDLSFSVEEAQRFLTGFNVQLDEHQVALVRQRSEGWAAGLQMAAITIHGSSDPTKAVDRVDLHHHSVAGYFLDEVLARQPPDVADFMLATSVLDELSAAACTALYGPRSAELLEHLYRSHLFVTMVDEWAPTYRYHQLVKEVLSAELHARDPARERALNEAIARHLAETGHVAPAVRHLLAAGQPAAATELLGEGVLRDFSTNPRHGSPLDLDDVNLDRFAGAPEFLVPLAVELLLRGAFERGSRALALAQQGHVDPERQPDLALKLALVRAVHCFFVGQSREALALVEEARNLNVVDDGLSEWLLALDEITIYCQTFLGQFGDARQLAKAVVLARGKWESDTEVLLPSILSQAALWEGQLDEAGTLAAQALSSATRLGFDKHYYTFCAIRTTGVLALERRDMATATRLTERALDLVGTGGRPVFDYLAQLDRARLWAAKGEIDEALASLPQARGALHSDKSPLLSIADQLESRCRLSLGDVKGAEAAAARLPDTRRLVMSAMVALAAGDPRKAGDNLREAPSAGATTRFHLEFRLLRASAAVMLEAPRAHEMVNETLAFIEQSGFVQTVLEIAPQFVDHLVESGSSYPRSQALSALVAARLEDRKLSVSGKRGNGLPEPLTEAEVRVLEKLSGRLTYVEMASELHLSLNTIKTHLRHTYMKLGVTSRASAVKRAAALGLI
jgi:LuxR family transcriptional regulator, maltose regulon positive regulatory protein